MPIRPAPRVVVLLEGRSDVAVVQTLAAARGLPADRPDLELVDMGGATNVRRHLRRHTTRETVVLGLCDAGEADFFLRALRECDRHVEGLDAMADLGFHVCHADLEDELIRALGPTPSLEVLRDQGLTERFETFTRQPAWRDRPVPDQLRRFAGTTSGRKATLDAALASALPPADVPGPLRRLLDHVESSLSAARR